MLPNCAWKVCRESLCVKIRRQRFPQQTFVESPLNWDSHPLTPENLNKFCLVSGIPKRVRSKRGRTQKDANECKRAQMSAKQRKHKFAKEHKRAFPCKKLQTTRFETTRFALGKTEEFDLVNLFFGGGGGGGPSLVVIEFKSFFLLWCVFWGLKEDEAFK